MDAAYLVLGKISGIYGVAGWVRVFSYTRPHDNIFQYPQWRIGDREYAVLQTRKQDKRLVAQLAGINDREQARALIGQEISVERQALPELPLGEYYWADLIGLQVRNSESPFDFGKVSGLMETGSNDVLVVQGDHERLIPFIMDQVVKKIDLDEGIIWVDWDPDF